MIMPKSTIDTVCMYVVIVGFGGYTIAGVVPRRG